MRPGYVGMAFLGFCLGFLTAGYVAPEPDVPELSPLDEEVQIRMLEVMEAELEFYSLIQEIAEECRAVGLPVSQCFSSLSSGASQSGSSLEVSHAE